MTTISGVDYPWSHPGGAALRAAGKQFAARYLSHDATKNITRAEADDLAAHGIWAVVVWETTANRAGAGRAAGIADAQTAVQQAAAAGMPASRPIYFAVDYDASPSAVVAYFQGVASVVGLARTGVYGGYRVVEYLLDHRLATWAWQTAAWSGGLWDARAVIRQPATTIRINGVDCDIDTAQAADYGQWMPGKTPLEDPVATLDADDKKYLEGLVGKVAPAVWTVPLPEPGSKTGETHLTGDYLRYNDPHYTAVLAAIKAQGAATSTAVVQALTPLIGKNVDTAAVVAAVQQAIADATVHVNVDVTGPAAAPAA